MRFTLNPFTKKLDAFEAQAGPGADIEFLSGDSGGNVGPDGSGVVAVAGNPDIDVVGTPGTSSFQLTNLTKVTQYIVDAAAGTAPYQTIQAALTAVGTAGATALVIVRPGTYTEDLTFPDQNVTLQGDEGLDITLDGTHSPSNSHNLTLNNLLLTDASNIFSSVGAGAGDININNSFILVTNGFVFNLVNWTGQLLFDNCGEASTNDGVVNNTGGATIKFINTEMGAGSGQTMTLTGNGNVRFDTCNVNCPVNIGGSGTFIFQNGCKFANTVTIGGTKSGTCVNTSFLTGANQALVYNSATTGFFSDVTFDSSNDPAIGGTGTIEIGQVSYLSNSNLNAGLTVTYTSVLEGGTAFVQELSLDRGKTHLKTTGTGTTIDAATADLYTLNLGTTGAGYRFVLIITGYATAVGHSVGYTIDGSVKTDGTVATIVDVINRDADEDTGDTAAQGDIIASGNSAIVRVTGVVGDTYNWRVIVEWVKVE